MRKQHPRQNQLKIWVAQRGEVADLGRRGICGLGMIGHLGGRRGIFGLGMIEHPEGCRGICGLGMKTHLEGCRGTGWDPGIGSGFPEGT